ncbi:MAG: clostripain-related cysteine peptidase [Lachnospiraceae bacterium]|nr:clostripain-related cysteine peptidase [Lachnospiraceae bacterium]
MRKKRYRGVYRLVALMTVLCLVLMGCGSEAADSKETEEVDSKETEEAFSDESYASSVVDREASGTPEYHSVGGRAVRMALADDGTLSITRSGVDNPEMMGEEGKWTIFVYMCGSDLESQNGMASGDIEEMINGTQAENLRYVVATGGANAWQNELVDASKVQYLLIEGGDISVVGEASNTVMSDPATLQEFLSWGVSTYPADRMGLIFWNHGGGSISGVCFDEKNEYHSLSLSSIDGVLDSVCANMTDQFEFIGFDACLMGTVEDAFVLASYARYMYGSEETEPGYGWDYSEIGRHIYEHEDADGASLGKVVVDSFYSMCEQIESQDQATLSVIDLSKIDDLAIAYNKYAMNLYNATQSDSAVLAATVRNVLAGDSFGGNTDSEGYTNMVDLGAILDAGGDMDGAAEAKSALEDCIVYKKNGKAHAGATGLSTYYPLMIQGSNELSTFGNIAISPYYLGYVDRAAYATANGGDMSAYNADAIFTTWESYQEEGAENAFDSSYEYYEGVEQTGNSPYITFASAPALTEDGSFGFTLTPEAIDNASSVEANVFVLSEDQQFMISYGITADINMDWETGTFSDAFDGTWFALPDGQTLCVNVQSQEDGYDVYSAPVKLNGEETNLLLIHDYENNEAYISGIWDGMDENGMSSRDVKEIKDGDTIVPIYDAYALDSDDESTYEGSAYTVQGELNLTYASLPDGEYIYSFNINDLYGDYLSTDPVNFTVEGENVYFTDMSANE